MEYLGDDKLIKTVINYSRSKTDKTLNEKEIKGKFLEEKKINIVVNNYPMGMIYQI